MFAGLIISVIVYLNILSRVIVLNISVQEQPDTISINKRNENLFANARRNPDMVIPMVRQILHESEKINYLRGKADASLTLGLAWFTKYFIREDSAQYYYMQAYEIYRKLDNISGKARACFYLSYVFSLKGDLTEAERYGTLSLNFFEQTGDNRGVINSYSVLAYFAQHQKDFKKAVALIQQAIDDQQEIQSHLQMLQTA